MNKRLKTAGANVYMQNVNSSESNERTSRHIGSSNGYPNIQISHYDSGNTAVTDQLRLYFTGTDFYITGKKDGADSVSKKNWVV